MITKLFKRRDKMFTSSYEETHQKLLDSGKRLFLEKGFQGANLREICKDAGVTTGALYRHFQDKEALFSELVEDLYNIIMKSRSQIEEITFSDIDIDNMDSLFTLWTTGSVYMTERVYPYKDIFRLLLECSEGTKYLNFFEELVALQDKNSKCMFQILKSKGLNIDIPSDSGLHILNHSFMHAVVQTILHSESIEEAKENTIYLSEFFNGGRKKVWGLK